MLSCRVDLVVRCRRVGEVGFVFVRALGVDMFWNGHSVGVGFSRLSAGSNGGEVARRGRLAIGANLSGWGVRPRPPFSRSSVDSPRRYSADIPFPS